MSTKVNTRGLIVLGLAIILVYSGARTLATMGNSSWRTAAWTEKVEFNPQSFVQNLEEFFSRLADTVYAYDYAYDDSRNPLRRVKLDVVTKTKAQQQKSQTRAASEAARRKPRPRLAGLILDKRDPAAIIEVGKTSFTVKRGDFIEGNMVIEIDEGGVHLLIDGEVVTVR
jgi:Tfp pilus assembly protein PilP